MGLPMPSCTVHHENQRFIICKCTERNDQNIQDDLHMLESNTFFSEERTKKITVSLAPAVQIQTLGPDQAHILISFRK